MFMRTAECSDMMRAMSLSLTAGSCLTER